MKLEGLTYFVGLTLGIWMLKSFYRFALFPSIVGCIFAFLGSFGYMMMICRKFDKRL